MNTFRIPGRIIAFFFLLPFFLLTTCKEEIIRTRTYHTKVPFYLSVSALRAQVITAQAPRKLSEPGKIYIYGNYLFINEVNRGIHIVDNTNPSAPRFINFIDIPGNADMAVNSNILYADTYADLLAFDISDPAHIRTVKRVEDVFENVYLNKSKGIITGYKDTVITEIVRSVRTHRDKAFDSFNVSPSSYGNQSYGTGGSTARFTLMNGNLYTVDKFRLKLFNVSNPSEPRFLSSIQIGTGIETIFPYQDKLFIGSTMGMHIYDATNPSAPVKLSTYQHLTSCDPVVVQGKYAYVTLRSGSFCRRGINVLDVLNIEDASKPVLVSSFPMLNPHGLAVSGSNLFVCEGQYGIKAFDNSDVLKIGERQRAFVTGINAADVIPGPGSLIVTGIRGIYQYDYSDPSALKLLSHLRLKN